MDFWLILKLWQLGQKKKNPWKYKGEFKNQTNVTKTQEKLRWLFLTCVLNGFVGLQKLKIVLQKKTTLSHIKLKNRQIVVLYRMLFKLWL